MKGYVQVYTGHGKGKTTAALGLAVRAAGARLKVFIAQFIKSGDYSEIKSLQRFSDFITVEQFGRGCLLRRRPAASDIELARNGLERIKSLFSSGEYHLFILDEANIAVKYELFSAQDILDLIALKPKNAELVITGRDASPLIIEKADLVTEMREVKHYFQKGVQARTGIEK